MMPSLGSGFIAFPLARYKIISCLCCPCKLLLELCWNSIVLVPVIREGVSVRGLSERSHPGPLGDLLVTGNSMFNTRATPVQQETNEEMHAKCRRGPGSPVTAGAAETATADIRQGPRRGHPSNGPAAQFLLMSTLNPFHLNFRTEQRDPFPEEQGVFFFFF